MANRSASNARNEILDLLKADHRKVKQVFRKFEEFDIEGDPEAAQEMVLQACNDLEVHAVLEEELFYPAVREAIKDTMVVAEAEVEHDGAKRLIAELRGLDPSEEAFAASFKVLGEYVKHHIREEENEMFEQLERARIDWESLRDAMLERREALLGESGDAEGDSSAEAEEASEPSMAVAAGAGRGAGGSKRQGARLSRAR
jgi:hypothetical protein